jgi:hypothetical protein
VKRRPLFAVVETVGLAPESVERVNEVARA